MTYQEAAALAESIARAYPDHRAEVHVSHYRPARARVERLADITVYCVKVLRRVPEEETP